MTPTDLDSSLSVANFSDHHPRPLTSVHHSAAALCASPRDWAAQQLPGLPHEQAGEAFARDRVGEGMGWLIGQHVPAKRYLVAVDEAYFGQLSPVSVRSLERQGGPMSEAEVAAFRSHPRAEDAVALRRWDEAAKDPADAGLPMAELLRVFDRYRMTQGHA
jgi:predicted HD phosphohydrolase